MTVVLDASAIIAVIDRERGCEAVAQRLDGARLSAVNLGEILAWVARRGGDITVADQTIRDLGIAVVSFDEAQAVASARLFPLTKPLGLSCGDRACLALGMSLDAAVLTADRTWVRVPGVRVELVR